ncbi:hypothetical protein [Janthinobacterium sp.]|uniref:hypothetical protein n=1 Tax=Janthinobacterium sp. TaxID=1871054 RepID=UPI00261A8E8E|nr:hypothetical protein [Janthinobacterium sp.]
MSDAFSSAINPATIHLRGIDRNAIRAMQERYRQDITDALRAGLDIDQLAQQQHEQILAHIATLGEADGAAFKSIYLEEGLAFQAGPTPAQMAQLMAEQQAAEAQRKKTDVRVKRGIVLVIVWIAIAAYWLSR